jgi:hypothetical protein
MAREAAKQTAPNVSAGFGTVWSTSTRANAESVALNAVVEVCSYHEVVAADRDRVTKTVSGFRVVSDQLLSQAPMHHGELRKKKAAAASQPPQPRLLGPESTRWPFAPRHCRVAVCLHKHSFRDASCSGHDDYCLSARPKASAARRKPVTFRSISAHSVSLSWRPNRGSQTSRVFLISFLSSPDVIALPRSRELLRGSELLRDELRSPEVHR